MNRLGKMLLFAARAAVAAVGMLAVCVPAGAAEPPPRWKTGVDFQRALATEFDVVNWPQGSRLRDQLQRLARWQRVAIFLDRRIDPGQPIELNARQVNLESLLSQIAVQCGAMAVHVDCVVYIGPRDQISGLSAVAKQRSRDVRSLRAARRRSLSTRRSWGWNELAEPRQLLTELAREISVEIDGIDAVPHDLWPAVDLPPLSWTDRATIVLAGFGLTFEFTEQGRGVRLVPLPPQTLVKRGYSATLSQMKWERIARQFPDADIERSSNGITLQGTSEEHERLRKMLLQQPHTKRQRHAQPTKAHSLRVTQQPIGAILKTLEQQLHLRMEFASGVQEKLHTRVTFDLRDVPLDKLLDATLAPAALTFQRNGDVIRVVKQP